jgi:hypothetical protein
MGDDGHHPAGKLGYVPHLHKSWPSAVSVALAPVPGAALSTVFGIITEPGVTVIAVRGACHWAK